MTSADDEELERQRQLRDRERLSFQERLYGKPYRVAKTGFIDGRSERRTDRIIQLPLRVHPRMKAMVRAIMERDRVPSMVVLFELMAQAYLEKIGDIDWSKIPSDEELLLRIESKRDEDDAE